MANKILINWRSKFNQTIRMRGMDYYKKGFVKNVLKSGNHFYASVLGSHNNIYNLEALLSEDEKELVTIRCNCPYAADGKNCKHGAALMYEIENNLEEYSQKEAVEAQNEDNKDDVPEMVLMGGSMFYNKDGFVAYREVDMANENTADAKDLDKDKENEDAYAVDYFDYAKIIENAHIKVDTWKKGMRLIMNNAIKITEERVTDKAFDGYGSIKVFEIKGSLTHSLFPTELTIGPTEIVYKHCTDLGMYRLEIKKDDPDDLCLHEAAILYLAKDKIKEYSKTLDYTDIGGRALLGLIDKKKEKEIKEQELKEKTGRIYPRPQVDQAGNIECYFTIGNGKKAYYITDLLDFVTCMRKGIRYKTRSGKIAYYKYMFDEKSLRLIGIIEDYVDEFLAITSDLGYRLTSNRSDRINCIRLRGVYLDEFFDIMKGDVIEYEVQGVMRKNNARMLLCTDGELKIDTYINTVKNKNGQIVHVDVKGDMPRIFKGANYGYFASEKTFTRISLDNYNEYELLHRISCADHFEFKIGLKNLNKFFDDALPMLKKSTNLDFEEEETVKKILPPKPEFNFYLDRDPKNIICKVTIDFDGSSYDFYEKEKIDAIVRDEKKEAAIENKLIEMFEDIDKENSRFLISLKNEERVFDLYSGEVESLLNYGKVFYTDSFKSVKIRHKTNIRSYVNLSAGLLDFDFEADDIEKKELVKILAAYKSKSRYYIMKNGDMLDMSEDTGLQEISNITDAIDYDFKKYGKEKVYIPAYRALFIGGASKNSNSIMWSLDERLESLIDEFDNIKNSNFELPKSLKCDFRKYQIDGYKWMSLLAKYGFGGILADEMGLGKTLQAISLLARFYEDNKKALPSLIVVPASLVYNWGEEIRRFAPKLKYKIVNGKKDERKNILSKFENNTVYISSYDSLKRDISFYEESEFKFEFIDEAQYIKNNGSAAAKTVKSIVAKHKFALTGTPIENRLSELWSIFDYLMPGFLGRYDNFKKKYEAPIAKDGDEEALQRLKSLTAPFILRRRKKDVLKDLPDKIEEIRYANMDEKQGKIYKAQIMHIKNMLDSSDDDFNKNKIAVLAELMKLRQICCNPRLCFENYDGESAKTDLCMNLVGQVVEGEHKALIFSQFVSMIEILKERLDKEGIKYYEITGKTSASERLELVNKFNNDDTPLFLISLKAGGTGLNLTGADVVIHYDPWWNLAVQNQATDRAHRIGQENVVTVYKLIMNNTIEEKIVELQEKKRKLSEDVLAEGMDKEFDMSKKALMDLIKFGMEDRL